MVIKTEEEKNIEQACKNPNCDNKTNSSHSKFCGKCAIRHHAKNNGYELNEEIEIDMGNNKVGYVLKSKS